MTSGFGVNFPPDQLVTLQWADSETGVPAGFPEPEASVATAGDGSFTAPLLVFPKSPEGPRALRAAVGAFVADALFLVAPGSVQGPDFVAARLISGEAVRTGGPFGGQDPETPRTFRWRARPWSASKVPATVSWRSWTASDATLRTLNWARADDGRPVEDLDLGLAEERLPGVGSSSVAARVRRSSTTGSLNPVTLSTLPVVNSGAT